MSIKSSAPGKAQRNLLLCLLISSLAAQVQAIGIPSQGTWATSLEGRDLDGDPATAEAYYDAEQGISWLADVRYPRTTGADANGRLTLNEVDQYVAGLDAFGVTGWRLPRLLPVNGTELQSTRSTDGSTDLGCAGVAGWIGPDGQPTSELAQMYYVLLGNDPTACDSAPGQTPGGGLENTGPFVNLWQEPG